VVEVDLGDDAAVVRAGGRAGAAGIDPVVVTVDAAVSGVHFPSDFNDFYAIGRRSVTAAISDVPAMGARPTAVLVALGLPPSVDDAALEALVRGAAAAAAACGCRVVGGNLSRARELSITTTALGALLGERAVTRGGATAGDSVLVSGVVGAAALGLRALLGGRRDSAAAPFIDAWTRPRARVDLGSLVAAHASACIDVSDGLLADLGHVARTSGVGLRVDPARLPLRVGAEALARELGADATALALSGGEDYELAVLAPAATRDALLATGDFTEIGAVDPRVPSGCVWLGASTGPLVPAGALERGFDHFSE
jgi:thiamine-monophosphate kinase